ncbi:MAG: hypothetical protein NVSMB27_06030 [Ktedonobacteraceae bacterium]
MFKFTSKATFVTDHGSYVSSLILIADELIKERVSGKDKQDGTMSIIHRSNSNAAPALITKSARSTYPTRLVELLEPSA